MDLWHTLLFLYPYLWFLPETTNTENWSWNSRNGNKHQVVPTLFLFLLLERNALEITWRRRNLCVVTQERLRRHVVKSTSWRIFGKIDKVSYQILFRLTAFYQWGFLKRKYQRPQSFHWRKFRKWRNNLWIAGLPRALSWARCFCPFWACGAYFQNLKIQIYPSNSRG